MTQRVTLFTSSNSSTESSVDAAFPAGQPVHASNTIDQVRELLYGEAMRHHDRRVGGVEETVQLLDQTFHRRLDDMQATIETLGRALRLEQAEATRSIGLTIMEIGRQIMTLSEGGDRGADRKSR